MVVDLFGAFWDEFTLLKSSRFIIIFILDALVILFIAIRSLWFKVNISNINLIKIIF